MAFVDVTNFYIRMERFGDTPAADPEHDFLHQAYLASTPIELGRDTSIHRTIQRIVTIQQIELHAPDRRLPYAELDHTTRQFKSIRSHPPSSSITGSTGIVAGSL